MNATDADSDAELQRIRHEKMRDLVVGSGTTMQLPGNGKPVHVESVEHFKDLIEKHQDTPIVVDFWAEWCGPCKMLGPIFEQAAGKFKDKVLFLKVNSDELPALAQYFRVSSIPDVILIHKKEVKGVWIGLRPLEFYTRELEKFLQPVP